jgi:spore germination protein
VRRQLRTTLSASALVTVAACAPAVPPPSLTPASAVQPFVAGYHPYWANASWEGYPFDLIDELFFFEAEVGADGSFVDRHGWPGDWAPMLRRAREADVQVVPTVSQHDPEAFEQLFTDSHRIDRLVESTLGLLHETPGLAGIHLDFEVFQPVTIDARDGFTAFVALLVSRLREELPGKSISSFVLAFDDDDVFNERAIAQLVDYVVVQGYDYHSSGSENAGPVGATRGWGRLNWEAVVDRFEALGVAPAKLLMGVPLYGYEWPVSSDARGAPTTGIGRTVPLTAPPDVLPEEPRAWDRAARYEVRRDPDSGVPWYVFESEEGWVQGWFEDGESLRTKYEFVRSRGLGGIAIFPLAYGEEGIWADIRRVFR